MDWQPVCQLDEIPPLGARVVAHPDGAIAVFRADGDRVFALRNACPHEGGPLSEGIVHGNTVTCPLHNWKVDLDSGCVCAPDQGCARRYDTQVDAGVVWLEA